MVPKIGREEEATVAGEGDLSREPLRLAIVQDMR